MNLFLDIETYSEADLKKVGAYRYAEDPSTRVLMVAWAIDDGDVELWEAHAGASLPAELDAALRDSRVTKHAWNAAFERAILERTLGVPCPPEHWRCTMIQAYSLSLPGSLEECGAVIGLPTDKAKLQAGRRLIGKFCKPRTAPDGEVVRRDHRSDPQDWHLFRDYCMRDVVAEREIHNTLARWPMSDSEWHLWAIDQQINDRGLPIDRQFVRAAIQLDEQHSERLLRRACELTGLHNPNSRDQLIDWLNKFALGLETLTKADVADALNGDNHPEVVREVLGIRQQLARASTKKFAALERAVCEDGRLRGCLQFYGAARTGRWAGRIFQPQNLPRGSLKDVDTARRVVASGDLEAAEMMYDDLGELLTGVIRPSVMPSVGQLVVADFSAIEARVLAWMAGEEWRLEVFRTHGKIYEASASRMFNVPLAEFERVRAETGKHHPLRQKGKVAELALGYQGGVQALVKMGALDMGLAEDELPGIVDAWRNANPHIRQLWRDIEDAARMAVSSRRTQRVGAFTFLREGPFLFIALPSGRRLAYLRPRLEDGSIVFEGVNSVTRQWGRQTTYGGKLVENLCQAVARDCLAESLVRLHSRGYQIVAHVHDEVLIEEPADQDSLHDVEALMGAPVPWAPDLPLRADGYTCRYYVKAD